MNRLLNLKFKYKGIDSSAWLLSENLFMANLISKEGNEYAFYYNKADDTVSCNIGCGDVSTEEYQTVKGWYNFKKSLIKNYNEFK